MTYADGTTATGSFDPSKFTSTGNEWSSPQSITGEAITSIAFTDVTGSGLVDLHSTTSIPNFDQNLSFNVTTTDGDGSTASGTIGIALNIVEQFPVNYGTADSGLAPFNGSYHELTDAGSASSSSPYVMIGDSSNDIFFAANVGDTMQAHSATTGNNIFEIANISSPNELITNFNSTNDVIDLTQLLSNVNTSAQGFNISNYVEYIASGQQAAELLINQNGGGFGQNHTGAVETVATIDTNAPNSQTPATHPAATSGQPSPILIAYQDQSHLVHSVHAHTG